MNCCLVQVALLLISCAIIIACPQHHHHYQRPQVEVKENVNATQDDEGLSDGKTIQKRDIEELVIENENETAAVRAADDELVAENKQIYKREILEVITEGDNETAAAAEMTDLNSTKEDLTKSENLLKKNVECVCALFAQKIPLADEEPLISKTFQNVTCGEQASGKDVCKQVCLDYAASNQENKGLLCSVIKTTTNLTGYLYSKHCETGEWTYTGMETPKPICCKDGKPLKCEAVE